MTHAEHRSQPAPPPFGVALTGDPPRVVVQGVVDPEQGELPERILTALTKEPLTRTQLRDRLAIRNEALGAALTSLEADGRLLRVDGRLTVPVPAVRDQ